MNRQLVFLPDGGNTVRNIRMRMSSQAEHVLDWFHVALRLTLMRPLELGVCGAGLHGRRDYGSEPAHL
jgi:hypothetical protein